MNMNQPFKYEFNEVKFYEFTIRMTIVNNTEMYLVSDLLKQYNEINNTNKCIHDWMKRKDTQELLQFYRDTTPGMAIAMLKINEDNFIDILGVIMRIDYKINNNITNKAYIVNGAILHDILMWADKVFAHKVYTFLDEKRKNDNNYLNKEIKRLQNRYIVNDNTQQWTYVLKIVKGNDGFYHIKSNYSKRKYIDNKDIMNTVYYVRNLPNGCTFRYFIYEHLLPIIDKYNGKIVDRTHFIIEEDLYDENDTHLDYLIRNAIDQTINELCWKI